MATDHREDRTHSDWLKSIAGEEKLIGRHIHKVNCFEQERTQYKSIPADFNKKKNNAYI